MSCIQTGRLADHKTLRHKTIGRMTNTSPNSTCMKLHSLFTTGLLSLGASTALLAQGVTFNVPANETTPAAATSQVETYTEAQLVETFGWFIMARLGIQGLELTPEQVTHFARGVGKAASGQDAPYDLAKIGPAMDEFIQGRQMAAFNRLKAESERESREFFANLKSNTNVKELSSGLRYEIVQAGEAAKPTLQDLVSIHYTGTLVDGSVFDSTEGMTEPAEIKLAEAISGWSEGVQLIGKGGKIKLYIPAHLAYGDEGAGEIPPGAALIFEVELVDFKPAPAETPAN